MDSKVWFYKYAPQKLSEMCLTKKQRDVFQKYIDEKSVPHLILHGHPGIGKSTLYFVLKNELQATGEMLDGSTNRGISVLRDDILNILSKVVFSDTYDKRFLFIDEFDNISKDFMLALKGTIDAFDSTSTFLFATNNINTIDGALLDRCKLINLIPNSLEEKQELFNDYLRRGLEILKAENVFYDEKTLKIILKRCFPSMRNFIKILQSAYTEYGKITKEVLEDESLFAIDKIIDYIQFPNNDNWELVKKIVFNMQEPENIYVEIFTKVEGRLRKNTLREVVKMIADHSYKFYFSKNKQIMVLAFLTELMDFTKGKWITKNDDKQIFF